MMENELTGNQAGLTTDLQIRIALETIVAKGGEATIQDIYDAVESRMSRHRLSNGGRASLRYFVNTVAVRAGYIYAYDPANPGWRITPNGREILGVPLSVPEVVINVDTAQEQTTLSSTARGDAFELYILDLLKRMYPNYAWYHQGRAKITERGLDFIGSRVGDYSGESRVIGVQAKFHQENLAPVQIEWLKFLAGCFARRVDKAIFITSGRLTSEQRREAQEANVIVIEGRVEVRRIAAQHGLEPFDLFDSV